MHAQPVLFLTRTNSFRFAYRPFHLVCGRSVLWWLIFQKLMLFSSITLALSATNIARAYISIFNVHVTAHECRHNHKQFECCSLKLMFVVFLVNVRHCGIFMLFLSIANERHHNIEWVYVCFRRDGVDAIDWSLCKTNV